MEFRCKNILYAANQIIVLNFMVEARGQYVPSLDYHWISGIADSNLRSIPISRVSRRPFSERTLGSLNYGQVFKQGDIPRFWEHTGLGTLLYANHGRASKLIVVNSFN